MSFSEVQVDAPVVEVVAVTSADSKLVVLDNLVSHFCVDEPSESKHMQDRYAIQDLFKLSYVVSLCSSKSVIFIDLYAAFILMGAKLESIFISMVE